MADSPFKHTTAASYALAAISGVENDPSQIRLRVSGSLISVTHFPHARIRTPLNAVGVAGCVIGVELFRLVGGDDDEVFLPIHLELFTGPSKTPPRLAAKDDSVFAFSGIVTQTQIAQTTSKNLQLTSSKP